MATGREFTDIEKQAVLKWFKENIKKQYSDRLEIENCKAVKDFKKELPLLFKFAEYANTLNWKEDKTKIKHFIEKFKNVFYSWEEEAEKRSGKFLNYFKNINSLCKKVGLSIGDPEQVYNKLTALMKYYIKPKDYTQEKPIGYDRYFNAIKDDDNIIKRCKLIQEAFENKNPTIIKDVWGSQSSTKESEKESKQESEKKEEKKTSGSAASSQEPIMGGRAKNNNTKASEDDEEKRKEDIKDKVTDNIKTVDEIRRANNEPFARIFSLNPSEMRDKVNKDRKYDFKKEFDEFQAAIDYAHGMYNYIDKIRKNAPAPRLSKIDKARTKIKPIIDNLAAYYDEAKKQYEITHRLGYITDREAQNLVSRIFKCIRKADMELLKLGEIITNADIMTWREARANVAEYFKRRGNEIKRDVWEGTRVTRNIRDWFNEKKVMFVIRDIQKSFPPEEAEKMVKEFKNAYYNVSPENDQKLAEIKMALSDAHDEKATQEMKKTKEVAKTAFNKVKEGLLRKGDIKDVYYDLDEKGNRINYKETLKNKGLLPRAKEKAKSIFDKVAGKIGS